MSLLNRKWKKTKQITGRVHIRMISQELLENRLVLGLVVDAIYKDPLR